jgi:hypothetical protein
MLESKIQKYHMDRVNAKGGLSLKFTSPGRRSVPDCIDLLGHKPACAMLGAQLALAGVRLTPHQLNAIAGSVIGAAIQFTECKQPGKRPTEAQSREHDRLRSLGFIVNIVDGT